ncbi:hypothetical protein EVAR_94155_1 [Eumeta japonica]|uniref:Uncharacterized protein n=1 Tax=Eumeta variegata TaxID=151549 RepID=A0A4C1U6W3_EUMVA|nr:hypothetical protein EVAR_94155_1 [Eumeta japonica]
MRPHVTPPLLNPDKQTIDFHRTRHFLETIQYNFNQYPESWREEGWGALSEISLSSVHHNHRPVLTERVVNVEALPGIWCRYFNEKKTHKTSHYFSNGRMGNHDVRGPVTKGGNSSLESKQTGRLPVRSEGRRTCPPDALSPGAA